jgi:prepilin-type N-terminal cleavage/methylation domain-containing protein
MSFVRRIRCAPAFTLVELLTVIVIIGALSVISFGVFRGANKSAQLAKARSELALLATALEEFRRIYGDYPQTGIAQATLTPPSATTGPGLGTAQARLFNALTGAYGATSFDTSGRISGPNLVELGKFTLNIAGATTLPATFGVPLLNSPAPPYKPEQNVAFLDPWGNRYVYYYKASGVTGAAWQSPGYLLYSVGPDGQHSVPNTLTGIFTSTALAAANNADNVYANP